MITGLDLAQYPTRWSQYVGQERAKRMLQVAAKSARVRKARLDHVLIAHPEGGIGKTALAVLTATELRKPVRVITGSLNLYQARYLFAQMSDGDVLFWDEAHQMMDGGRKHVEWMLTFLQDCALPGPFGLEKQPDITIIAATTDKGALPKTIVDRFPLQPPLEHYSEAEAIKLAKRLAATVLEGMPALGTKDAAAIAAAGSHNPRVIRKLLVVLRDMHYAKVITHNGRYDVAKLLEWQGVTPDGLDEHMQLYLTALAQEFGGRAGVKALQERVGGGSLADMERVLMYKGLIVRTATGRVLTQDGNKRVAALEPVA